MPEKKPFPPQSVLSRPPLTLILGGASSGKTQCLQSRFSNTEPGHALLATASPAEAAYLLKQISEGTERTKTDETALKDQKPFVQTFRHLIRQWSVETLEPGASHVSKAFQRLALAEIFRKETKPTDYFGRLLESPGFVPALVERVREWKLSAVTSAEFLQGAENLSLADPDAKHRITELAKLYASYDELLSAYRLYDEEDALRRVRELLERGNSLPEPYAGIETLLIDGFHLFNRAQILLLRAFAEREIEVVIALPYAPNRPQVFTSVERTLQTLREEFTLKVLQLDPMPPVRSAPLVALERRLFCTVTPDTPEPVRATAETLLLHDAPNPYIEVEMAAREIRRTYDRQKPTEHPFQWSDFAIVLRTQGDYAPILTAVFERYEIPIGIDGAEELIENPFLKTVLALLEVYRSGWKRDAVIAFLKSSYVGHSRLAVDTANRLAKTKRVKANREDWRAFALGLPVGLRDTVMKMAELESDIENRNEPLNHYAEWLLRIVNEFELETKIEEGNPLRAERDRTAWEIAKELLEAMQQLARMQERVNFTFAQFYERLWEAWSRTSALAIAGGDRVQVLEPYETRSAPLRVVIVMGLTERVFPRRILEDPFLRDSERIALREVGLHLEPQLNRADDERLYFYFAVTTPRERLILSYPRSGSDSDTLPSFYLDEIRNVIAEVPVLSRTLNDVAPRPEDVVCDADALTAFCAEAFDPRHPDPQNHLTSETLALLKRCQSSPKGLSLLKNVVASRHLPPLPRFESGELLKTFVAHRTVFNIAEIEEYRRCPFSYLLRYVFGLRPDAGEAAEAQIRNTVFRKTMHRYLRERKKTENHSENLSDNALDHGTETVSATEMEATLLEIAEVVLVEENPDLSPLQLRFLKRGLREALRGAAFREAHFAPKFGMKTAHIGLTFGFPLNGNTGESDPASVADPLYLAPLKSLRNNSEGVSGFATEPDIEEGVWLRGTIDRVDTDPTGRHALLMHYRTTAAPDLEMAERGESLTLPLSLLAMHHLFEPEPIAALYDAAGTEGRARIYRLGSPGADKLKMLPGESNKIVRVRNSAQYATMLENARAVTLATVGELREGKIGTKPGDHCEHCAYGDVCRTDRLGEHDGEQ